MIGAGPIGLAGVYEFSKTGSHMTVFERDDRIGGMTAFIDFAGTRIDRYCYFICCPDQTTLDYLK